MPVVAAGLLVLLWVALHGEQVRGPGGLESQLFLPQVETGLEPCVADEVGDSDNVSDALVICSGQVIEGRVEPGDLDDVYRILVRAGTRITATLSGQDGDADLFLFAPGSTDVNKDKASAESNQTDTSDERIVFVTTERGWWLVDVFAFDGTIDYRLVVESQ